MNKTGVWLLGLLLFVCVGCEDGGLPSRHTNELTYALWSAPKGNFAPQLIEDDYDGMIVELMFESLLMTTPESAFKGVLATSWFVSEDQKSVVFKLRKGVVWHDGERFDAEDVAFTLYYMANCAYSDKLYDAVDYIRGVEAYKAGRSRQIEGIRIIDSHTIEVTSENIYAPMLEHLGGIRIFPEHIWKNVDPGDEKTWQELLKEPIGTGPYQLADFDLDLKITMRRNPNYWGGTPKIETFSFLVLNAYASQVKMLYGELDMMQVTSMAPDVIKWCEVNGLSMQEVQYHSFQSITLNNTHPVLSDLHIRRAMAMAVDRQLIVDTLLFGHGELINTVYPKTFSAHPSETLLVSYAYNSEAAVAELIYKGGYRYQNGKLYKDSQPVELTLLYPTGNKARELSAPIIQENLEAIGMTVHLERVTFSGMMQRLERGDYDMALIGYGIQRDSDVSRLFASEAIGKGNYSRYSSRELDALLDAGVATFDEEERKAVYGDVAVWLNRELPVLFLYNWREGRILSKRLKGVECHPYYYFYNCHKWYFEED